MLYKNMINKEKIRAIICEEYARFIVEKYIERYGKNRLNKVKHIFANIASEMIIKNCFINQANDEWEESEHPRKKNGQFGKGGSSSESVVKSSNRDKIGSSKHKTVELPKEEYAQVMHELNTNLTQEQRKKKQITRAIGNSVYTVENNGFNNYKIIKKENIDEYFD